MKVIERFNLIDQIGRTLQGQMTFSDIDVYLTAYGIDCKDKSPSANSKWVYVKELLADVGEELILQIADELEIDHGHSVVKHKEATFWKVGYFRLFLSHLATFKVQTSGLQKVLKQYGISSFVAHEDIEPSREWQNEIEAGLQTMDAFVAILMPGFKESNWCDQEIGFAVGKGVLIIPVRKGLDPYYYDQPINPNKYSVTEGKITTAPWMTDFFTPILNQMNDLDFTEVKPVLDWQARFPVGRLTAPGYCWISGGIYRLAVADSGPKTPTSTSSTFSDAFMYTDLATAYENSVPENIRNTECGSEAMANAFGSYLKAGEMTGYSPSAQGYTSILQAAVASAVDAGIPNAQEAWNVINNRVNKADFGKVGPEFAIIPR